MKKPSILAAGLALAIGAGTGFAQSNPELAALQKRLEELEKKTSRLEAENRQLLNSEVATPPPRDADKIKLTKGLAELKLGGDLRLRYQYDNADKQVDPPGAGGQYVNHKGDQRSRWRYRLRLNADFKLGSNWYGGLTLQTGSAADSGFVDYGGGFSNYDIYISRAFIGWDPHESLTLLLGKQPKPFHYSELTWSNDVNPTGVSETVRLHKLVGDGAEETITGYTKDGAPIVSSTPVSRDPDWELTFVAGQYLFDSNNEYNWDSDHSTDAYLFLQQLIGSYRFSKDVKLTIAPTFSLYNAAHITAADNAKPFTDANIPAVYDKDGRRLYTGATRDLHLLQGPGELAFKVFGQKAKFVWDISYNLDGAKRTRDIYGIANHSGQDNLAWLLGLQLGDNRKQGDWSALVNYRQVGIASIDPNLNDSTWALSRLNVKGWKAALSYNFTDNVMGVLTFTTADDLRNDLIGGQATGGAALADLNSVQTLQVDFNVKF